MDNIKKFLNSLLKEQFMDELAERVAKKLAQRNGPKNTLFKNESKRPKKSYTRDIYYDSCGPSYNIYDSCGSSSMTVYDSYGSCGNSTYRSGC